MLCDGRVKDAGFTLVEVVVVLALMAIAAGVLLPYLGPQVRRAALDGAGVEVRAALRNASTVAVLQGRTMVFHGDRAGGGYWIGSSRYQLAATRHNSPIIILGRVSFFPWGGSSGGRVSVTGPQGNLEILVSGVTGRGTVQKQAWR